ncbi:AAA family ATPase [Chlorobium sp.]|uniref:GumC family protein n=1 Tax=Chlorobium sp. TaxID=1095 RepID=UPI0025BF4ECC|nr:AAA family ATPase [Chlorobium sp.]
MNEQAPREALPFGKPLKSLDLQGFLRRYGLFVIVIGSFLFTLSVPVVLLLSKPNYEAGALMRIDPVIPSLITKSEDPSIINYYQDYANTQARRMKDHDVLKKTVERLTPDQKAAILPKALPSEICANILNAIIHVKTVPGTHLLEITASSPRKEGLAPLINNFMQVFLEKIRKDNEMKDSERLTFLQQKKQALTTDIGTIEEKLNILTKEISTADYSENFNLANLSTIELQKQYINAFTARLTAEHHLEEVEKSGKDLSKLSLDPMIEEMVMGDPSLDVTSSWTYQQQQQLRSTTDGLTPNNPDRIYVEQRMKAMQEYEKKLLNDVRKTAKTILYGKRDYELKKDLIAATNQSEHAKKQETVIHSELDSLKKESVRISLGLHLGEALEAELKHKRTLLEQIDTRINELEIEGKAPLRLSIESRAREPEVPIGSNTQKLLIMFFAASFGSVTLLFLGIEFFDNRIRRPEEIKLALGYPPLPTIVKAAAGIPPHRMATDAPGDLAALTISSIAVHFIKEQNRNNVKIIIFSGVDEGVGTTTIALNCAQALARMKPNILFIDANIGNSSLHTLDRMPAPNEGLAGFLDSSSPLCDYTLSAGSHMPDLLYAGSTREASALQYRFGELIEQAKAAYDVICIDCPPALESSITTHIALHSDLVCLICLGNSTRYRTLRQAAESLVKLEIPAIAIIMNEGGIRKSMNIDRLLESKPGIISKINTGSIEKFLRNLPPPNQLLAILREKIQPIITAIRKTATRHRKKKKDPS